MGANISPKDAALVFDCAGLDEREYVLKYILLAVFDIDDLDCEINMQQVFIEIHTESEELKDGIVRYVLSIPALNDEGEYTSVDFAFDSCVLVTAKRTLYKRHET